MPRSRNIQTDLPAVARGTAATRRGRSTTRTTRAAQAALAGQEHIDPDVENSPDDERQSSADPDNRLSPGTLGTDVYQDMTPASTDANLAPDIAYFFPPRDQTLSTQRQCLICQ
jgi:hypothetical protein